MSTPTHLPADQGFPDAQPTVVGGDLNPQQQAMVRSAPTLCAPAAGPKLPADHGPRDAHSGSVGGDPNTDPRDCHAHGDAHGLLAVAGPNPEQAILRATPNAAAPARPNLPADQTCPYAHTGLVGGDPNGNGQTTHDTQRGRAAAPTSPAPTKLAPAPTPGASERGTQAPDQATWSAMPKVATPGRAKLPPTPARHATASMATSPVLAGSDDQRDPAIGSSMPKPPTLGLADPVLGLAADVLDDLERVRIANQNRLRQLTRDETDSDGLDRGFGLPVDHPDVARLAALVDALTNAEHQASLNLRRMLRKHPLGPWVKNQRGVGEQQSARLLATLGDPYWHTLYNRPRTVSELWSYAGYHVLLVGHRSSGTHPNCADEAQLPARQSASDTQMACASGAQTGGNPDQARLDAHAVDVGVAAARVRGQRANWNAAAKMRTYVVAESCLKQLVAPCHVIKGDKGEYLHAVHCDGCRCSPYRVIYDNARTQYAGTLHPVECKRCGPTGHPAAVGSPRSAQHQHAMALRRVSKELLKHLWREAKRIHTQ